MPLEQTPWRSCSIEYLKLNTCNLPVAYGSCIEMEKTGPRIVPHSPPLQIRGEAAHHLKVTPGEAHVDCLALNMHTMRRHAGIVQARHGIGGWRAVGRQDVKRVTQSHNLVDGVQEVKQLRVNGFHLIGVMIAQDVVNIP